MVEKVSRRGKGRGRLGWGVGGRSGLSSEMTNGWTFVVGGEEEDGARGVWWWRFWGFSGGWVGLPGRLGGGFGIFGDTSDFPRKMAGGFPSAGQGGQPTKRAGKMIFPAPQRFFWFRVAAGPVSGEEAEDGFCVVAAWEHLFVEGAGRDVEEL